MRKRSNRSIYHFEWGEPNIPPPPPKVWEVPKNCHKCSKTLTFEDRKTYLGMDEGHTNFGTLTKLLGQLGFPIVA